MRACCFSDDGPRGRKMYNVQEIDGRLAVTKTSSF